MSRVTCTEFSESSVLPAESILLLKVEDSREREVQGDRGSWTKLELKFKILAIQSTGDGSPTSNYDDLIATTIWGSVALRLTTSPDNRLRQWAEAILGMEIGSGFELDTDYLTGRTVRGVTSVYDRRQIDPRTGQRQKAHQVESLIPARGQLNGTPQATQVAQTAPAGARWTTPGVPTSPAAAAPGWQQPAQPVQQPVQPLAPAAAAQPVAAPVQQPTLPVVTQANENWDEPPF